MATFKKYKREQIAELRPVDETDIADFKKNDLRKRQP